MRAIVSTWTYFIVIRYAFILSVVHQSTTYELKESAYCEWYCTKVQQQWDDSCPVYGSCRWYCQAKRKDCILGTRYHCARDLHNKDLFIEACAAEIFCLAGEEPQISLHQSGKAIVFCLACYRRNRYNGRHNTSSAVFSECPTIKTNLCVQTEHKIDCDKTSFWDLTKTDGYCRCDASNGYAAQSKEMCFYENKRCFRKKCPAGNVLSLNYTCVQECPVGFAQDESDNCNTLKSPHPEIASVFSTVTTVSEDKETHLSTENPPNESRPNKRLFEVVVTGASLFIAAFTVSVFVKQKKDRRRKRQDIQSPIELSPFLMPENLNRGASAVIIEGADSKLRATTTWASAKSIEHDLFCKEIWQELCNYDNGQGRFPSEKFVNRIDNIYFDLDNLKESKISCDDKYFGHEFKSNKVKGFTAWENPGENSTCLYTWISHLLCGDDRLKSIIRLAAARFALQNFDTYLEWLTNAFVIEKSLDDAHFFFKIHGVEFKVNGLSEIKIGVQLAFADLVKEILNPRSGNGPFYVKFLSGALNCNIIQHYEHDSFARRKVERTQCLLIPFPIIDCSDRELHIFWMKSRNDMNNYRVLRLFKSQEGHGQKWAI